MAKVLTAPMIEALKAGDARKEIPDGGMPGLFLVVQPRCAKNPKGAKSWAYRYRFEGTPKKLTLGGYPLIPLKTARKLAQEAARTIAEGRDPSEEKKAKQAAEVEAARKAKEAAEAPSKHANYDVIDDMHKLIFQFAQKYLMPLSKRHRGEVGRLLGVKQNKNGEWIATEDGGWVLWRWGSRPISSVEKKEAMALLDKVPIDLKVQANRILRALKTMFKWAKARDIIGHSPVADIGAPKREKKRDHVLDDPHLRACWLASYKLDVSTDPFRKGALVRLLMLLLQRRGETAGMRWSELDLENKIWDLPPNRTKNGHRHLVPLPDLAVEILQSIPRKEGSDYVFPTRGKSHIQDYDEIQLALNKGMLEYLRELIPFVLHDLRRSGSTTMQRFEIPTEHTDAVQNHKLKGTTAVYNRYEYFKEKLKALNVYAEFIKGLTGEDERSEQKEAA